MLVCCLCNIAHDTCPIEAIIINAVILKIKTGRFIRYRFNFQFVMLTAI